MDRKTKLTNWMKNEVVLLIALGLCLVSSFIVPPSVEYFSYIDYRVLILLLCLMLVVAGLKELGLFQLLGEIMCSKVKDTRTLSLSFIVLCFVTSMLITNDVALITFVPFTISVYIMIGLESTLIPLVVLETIAANLGSMLTPIGNPQNLLLFSVGNMTVAEFVLHMLPLTLLSFLFIFLLNLKQKNIKLAQIKTKSQTLLQDKKKFWIYLALFVVCLGNVFHLYSHWIVMVVVGITIFFVDKKLFKRVDYSLLFTFIGFFIFIGNMKQIDMINVTLSKIIIGNELLTGVLLSQVISNVPAAMLLSGFTTDYKTLLYGINLGGLGTLIASMASLISYRLFAKARPEEKKAYFKQFTLYNFGLLILMYTIVYVISVFI